jgi:hypothetical protein
MFILHAGHQRAARDVSRDNYFSRLPAAFELSRRFNFPAGHYVTVDDCAPSSSV